MRCTSDWEWCDVIGFGNLAGLPAITSNAYTRISPCCCGRTARKSAYRSSPSPSGPTGIAITETARSTTVVTIGITDRSCSGRDRRRYGIRIALRCCATATGRATRRESFIGRQARRATWGPWDQDTRFTGCLIRANPGCMGIRNRQIARGPFPSSPATMSIQRTTKPHLPSMTTRIANTIIDRIHPHKA